jgi:Tol biopolymer transport system component
MLRTALRPLALVLGAAAWAQTTTRVSLGPGGIEANGPSSQPAIAGSWVAYYSAASNLVAGDTNGSYDLFVGSPSGASTERASLGAGGVQGNGDSGGDLVPAPAITPDGRFVVFRSDAANLVANDTNGVTDVFLRDRQLGTTERISVSSGGIGGNAASHAQRASISADGQFVCFLSDATNLVPGDNNDATDVFLRNRLTATTTMINLDPFGSQTSGLVHECSISADGRYVAFTSTAPGIVLVKAT